MAPPGRSVTTERTSPRVLQVTLDRPPVNAADGALLSALHEAFAAVPDDVDVVVLASAGEVFCAGNDIYEFEAMDPISAEELMATVRRAFWAIYDCPVPVVARVQGAALGTGLALAALCDVVIASDRACFGLPELDVGVLGGMKFGRRLVPELAVRRMFFTAEPLPAPALVAMGGPITVVAHDELDTTTSATVATMAAKGGIALRFAKRAMNAVEHLDIKTGYEYEQTFTVRMAARPEAKDAVRRVIDEIEARRRARTGGP